ncbi:hypothetical protein ABIB82_001660 [Bradyrhizobium sp. i1.8.4]
MTVIRKPLFWTRWQRWRATASFVDTLFKARFKARPVDASAADR